MISQLMSQNRMVSNRQLVSRENTNRRVEVGSIMRNHQINKKVREDQGADHIAEIKTQNPN